MIFNLAHMINAHTNQTNGGAMCNIDTIISVSANQNQSNFTSCLMCKVLRELLSTFYQLNIDFSAELQWCGNSTHTFVCGRGARTNGCPAS